MRCALIIILLPLVLAAAPFQNGSFENNPFGGALTGLPVGNTDITGWEVFNGNIEAVPDSFWDSYDLIYSLDLNGTGSYGGIRQTFDTTPGTEYAVTFWLSGNYAWGPNYTMDVSAAGSTQSYSSTATNPLTWTQHTFLFTANSASTTLSFLNTTPGAESSQGGPVLDLVEVQTAVPEPPLFLPVLAALACIAGKRRSRVL